jgi:hypothetical protein
MKIGYKGEASESAHNALRGMVGWCMEWSVTANNGTRFSGDSQLVWVDEDDDGYTRVTFLDIDEETGDPAKGARPFVIALNPGPDGFDFESFNVEVW